MLITKRLCDPQNFSISIRNNAVPLVTSFKYLGFIVDSDLKFCSHTDLVTGKLNSCSVLRRLMRFLPHTYCSAVLSDYNKCLFSSINCSYIRCGTVIYNCSSKNLPISWLDLRYRFLFSRFIFIFKVLKKNSCNSLSSSISIRDISYNLRGGSKLSRHHVNKKYT